MRLVIDTSIIIDKLRGGNRWDLFIGALDEFELELILPTIVIFELYSGKSSVKPQAVNKIINILKYFTKSELTDSIARRAGEIYRDDISTLQVPDYIVAATAQEIGGTVVTLNKKHLEKIPGLSIYPL